MPRSNTAVVTDSFCREHGVGRWMYREGHVGNASEVELRNPEPGSDTFVINSSFVPGDYFITTARTDWTLAS